MSLFLVRSQQECWVSPRCSTHLSFVDIRPIEGRGKRLPKKRTSVSKRRSISRLGSKRLVRWDGEDPSNSVNCVMLGGMSGLVVVKMLAMLSKTRLILE